MSPAEMHRPAFVWSRRGRNCSIAFQAAARVLRKADSTKPPAVVVLQQLLEPPEHHRMIVDEYDSDGHE
jgi:hypothetical protein